VTEPTSGPSASIRSLLERHRRPSPARASAGGAVLIVLQDGPQGVEVLLIERTTRASDPGSGQIALPGGHVEPTDDSLEATALRECFEEVGISSRQLARPPAYVTTRSAPAFALTVAVFATATTVPIAAPPPGSPAEVAAVFWMPRSALETTERVVRTTPVGAREVDAVVYQGHVLWGFTFHVLRQFFDLEPAS
jgi:8-oxo-dGTP pyrophosphatase MutT (NUDIX family)